MTKIVNVDLKIVKNEKLEIIVNEKVKKYLTRSSKVLNTKDIFDMLSYNKENEYNFIPKEKQKNVEGDENEMNRLYNYAFDLFKEIVESIDVENKKLQNK